MKSFSFTTTLNLINDLLDNLPLPSQSDRRVVEARALQPVPMLRRLLGHGRVMFFLQDNGFVKEFNLPSVMAILERMKSISDGSAGAARPRGRT